MSQSICSPDDDLIMKVFKSDQSLFPKLAVDDAESFIAVASVVPLSGEEASSPIIKETTQRKVLPVWYQSQVSELTTPPRTEMGQIQIDTEWRPTQSEATELDSMDVMSDTNRLATDASVFDFGIPQTLSPINISSSPFKEEQNPAQKQADAQIAHQAHPSSPSYRGDIHSLISSITIPPREANTRFAKLKARLRARNAPSQKKNEL